MLVPHDWLKEFVALDQDPLALAEQLTLAGVETLAEVEGVDFDERIVTARVVEKGQHPEADKLSLCRVDDGSGELRQIVCGAQNFKQGDYVVLARTGARVPAIGKLKKSKIRGQVSEGMMCSARELGIGEDHAGIIVLDHEVELGLPAREVLPQPQAVYEVDVYPNRPDCMGVVGVAREVSALTGAALSSAAAYTDDRFRVGATAAEGVAGEGETQVRVVVENGVSCPRYIGGVLRGVTVGPSDPVMAERLEAAGMRPINNVVDCTNYVLLELGQPVHAFDLRQLRGREVRIRDAREGERMHTLDGVERSLVVADLLICDAEGPQAVAGVMGGQDSEVADDTTDLFLEVACFDPASVRATSRRLGLVTESSQRFGRGVDPSLPARGFRRLVELLTEHAGGALVGEVADLVDHDLEAPAVPLRADKIQRLLGLAVEPERVRPLLEGEGFAVEDAGERAWTVRAPLARFDIQVEADLVEEVGRLVGYDKVPATLPPAEQAGSLSRKGQLQRAVRRLMAAAGFHETVGYAFVAEEALSELSITQDETLKLMNPLSQELAIMRPSLAPSLLGQVRANLARGRSEQRLFECRSVFAPGALTGSKLETFGGRPPRETAAGPPPANEALILGAWWMGGLREPSWLEARPPVADFYAAKGLLEQVAEGLGCAGLRFDRDELPPFLDARRSARVLRGKAVVGWVGRLRTELVLGFDLPSAPVGFELNLDALLSMGQAKLKARALSVYPPVERDLSFLLPLDVDIEAVLRSVKKANITDLEQVWVFDEYRGSQLPEGTRSVALRLRFQSDERTLDEADVLKRFDAAIAAVKGVEGVQLREG